MLELLTGLLVTAGLSPLVRRAAHRYGILDIPNHRSSHVALVPRGGGLACLIGVLLASCVGSWRGLDVGWVATLACAGLALVGFADDRVSLPALPRLLAQCLAGGVVGATLGGVRGIFVGAAVAAVAVNVVNFMDGINGITALTISVWGVGALVIGHRDGVAALSVLGAATAGAALGFLPWNVPGARLFLGDSGSYLFGALAASGIIIAWASGSSVVAVSAPLFLHVADSGWTLVRRAARGENLLEAHREHVYQRLVSRNGLSHTTVSSVFAALSLLITVAWALVSPGLAVVITVSVVALYIAATRLPERGLS